MKIKKFLHELKHHVPFTAAATIMAIIIVFLIQNFSGKSFSETSFEILHPVHVFASAMVTAGIFYKHKPKILPALLIGISGAIIFGSLSDIIFPWLGGNLFRFETYFHLPVIEIPLIIFASTFFGSIIGIKTKLTKMPHFIHVFLSVFASLFYLLAFSQRFSFGYFIGAFLIVFLAVIIPCCISDIFFPFIFLKK